MQKHFFFFVSFFAFLLNMNAGKANASDHSGDVTFGVARFVTPVVISENTGFSFLSEIGPESFRVNGTLGYLYCGNQRIKVGGEYLGQRLHFKFDDSHSKHWVHQWDIGGSYEYLFDQNCCRWLRSVELSGYYAESHGKSFSHDCFSFNHVSGADIWNIEAGGTIDTWDCGFLYAAIDYDSFRFKRHHHNHEKDGVGFTVALHQPVWCNLTVDFKYQYKRVYDYIEGLLNWSKRMECGDLALGVFANHVWGRDKVPSSTTVGGQIGFSFNLENLGLFGDGSCCYADGYSPYDCVDLAAWVAYPAVYIPQVIVRRGEGDFFVVTP